MNQDVDFRDEDEGTWHQPVQEPGLGRRHDQRTVPDEPRDPDQRAGVEDLASTRAEMTSPSGDVSQVPRDPAGASGERSHDTVGTRTLGPEGSSEWDAAPPPVFEEGKVVFVDPPL